MCVGQAKRGMWGVDKRQAESSGASYWYDVLIVGSHSKSPVSHCLQGKDALALEDDAGRCHRGMAALA